MGADRPPHPPALPRKKAQPAAEQIWAAKSAVRIAQWRNRCNLLHIGSRSEGPPFQKTQSLSTSHGSTGQAIAYLPMKQILTKNTENSQAALREDGAIVVDLRRDAIPSQRWRGAIGPSLYMTAVEAAPPGEGKREHGERCGREATRNVLMDAEHRALNDLPAWRPLTEAIAQPGPALLQLMTAAQLEAWHSGTAAEKEQAADWFAVHSPPGLDLRAKFPHSSGRHGLKGLTVAGRRCIRDAAALLQDHKDTIAFGTVTLPPAAAETATPDQLATFQMRWMQYARRLMIRKGLPPLLVLVAEIHPHRKTLAGGPVIHWHWAGPTRFAKGEKWAASVADWHRVTRAAHFSAFGERRGNNDGCRTEAARSNPGYYLSKYMTKACSDTKAFAGTEWERCIPKQWWGWTGEMRELVKACRLKPPSSFLRWCCTWARELADLGECRTELIQIGEDGPIVGRWFCWRDAQALDDAIEGWIGDEMDRLADLGRLGQPDWAPDPPIRGPLQRETPDVEEGDFYTAMGGAGVLALLRA